MDNFTLSLHERYTQLKKELIKLQKEYKKLNWKNDPVYIRRLIKIFKIKLIENKISLIENNLKGHL